MKDIQNIIKFPKEDIYALRSNYVEALKVRTFRDYVSLLCLPDELLMKYTSYLEDASIEFDHCQNCDGLLSCKNKMNGFILTPKKNLKTLTFDYIACSFKQKEYKDTKYRDNVLLFEIPKAIKNATLKDVYTDDKKRVEVIKYIRGFIEHYSDETSPKGLYLSGSFGTGKSYMIAALFNELAKKNVRSAIVYFPEFLRSLKESFDSDYKSKFNTIKKVPLLLIDDIGAENLTPWARDEILGSILQYRMDENLATFFTSNLNLVNLEEHLSMTSSGVDKVKARRIIERIKQLTNELELTTKNRRD